MASEMTTETKNEEIERAPTRLMAPFLTVPTLSLVTSMSAADPTRQLDRFTSGGKKIRVETFAPANAEALPSIVVLHGATGVEFANRFIAGLAQSFAEDGFAVHLVHYFDRTGATYADEATIRRSSAQWLTTVDDTVTWVRSRRPKARIGIFGYSLGGYLAAAESVSNDQISATVILSGGLDEASVKGMRRAPPMLILHGAADRRVPVSEAYALEAALRKKGGHPSLRVYPGEGHIMQMATYGDVVRRGTTFFQQNLNGSGTT
jgi:dienelactone hydrolase